MKNRVKKIYNYLTSQRRNKDLDQEMLRLSVPLLAKHVQSCQVYSDRQSLIASFPKNAIVAEVGVALGDFSADILRYTEPEKLFLIDAWKMNHPHYGEGGFEKVKKRFTSEIASGRVQVQRGYSFDRLAEFKNHFLDWVYIDAAHDYRSVTKDLNISYNKVKSGGIISGHDYHRWGKNGKRFGVLEAVNKFCIEKDLLFIGISIENNLNWSYALQITK